MHRRNVMLGMVGVIGATVLSACGAPSDDNESEPTATREAVEGAPPELIATTPPDTANAETPATKAAGGATAATDGGGAAAAGLAVTAGDLFFEPKALAGTASSDVVITITNQGAVQHDFAIAALEIETPMIDPGASVDVTVNAAAGDYEFHCTVPGHAEAGMTGTLTLA